MTNRPAIPAYIERQILLECGHRCAVCGSPLPLERAHIIPWCTSKEHKAEDLICLCANCHERADKENWGEKTLREYKKRPWVMRQYGTEDSILETTTTATITLEIEELPDFDERYQRLLQYGIAAFLDIPPNAVRIMSVKKASLKITVELPREAAKNLLDAYKERDAELYKYLDPLWLRLKELKMAEKDFIADLDSNKSAVVIVDMQNDFCSVGGYYDRHEKLKPDQRNELVIPSPAREFEPRKHIKDILGPSVEIIETALKNKKVEVIFVQADYGPLHGETKCPLFSDHSDRFPCRHGSWGQQLIDPLRRLKEEYCSIKYSKNHHSAFVNPEFGEHLDKSGIENLIIVGAETDWCLKATAEDAIAHGLKVIIPQDCTTSASGIENKCKTLKGLDENELVVITDSKEIVAWLLACNIESILRVFRTLHRLKELPRQGFIHFSFRRDETDSIAEHSFIVAWIAYTVAQELIAKDSSAGISLCKVVKMALIHDWGEAVAGDLSYRVKGAAFAQTEESAFKALVKSLPEQKELTALWDEYNAKESIESAIVKIADALDAWLQGLVTPSTWWPAWEDYNRKTEKALETVSTGLSRLFRRICDIARDPDVQIKLPSSPDTALEDTDVWRLLKFIKNIYCLKELPRHGFAIFGMKRSETDSFAGHSFTTACLSYLLSMSVPNVDQFKAIMMALIHDLPVAMTGDVSYDLQEIAGEQWCEFQRSAVDELTKDMLPSSREDMIGFLEEWNELRSTDAWIVKAAAALDAWEIGVTTPSAWMDAWLDYRKRNLDRFHSEGAPYGILKVLEDAYQRLADFADCKMDRTRVGRNPTIKLIRL